VEPVTVGIAVFGMNSGAYVSEIMRGGIGAVDIGQLEAARALGLSYPVAMLKVVVPQAIKNVIPTIGNEFITLIKETSVLSFITVFDVYTMFDNMVNRFGDPIVPYLAMALIYILLVLIITFLIKIVENILAKSDRNRKAKGGKAKA
jgi:polar amino acid transport system permease protein